MKLVEWTVRMPSNLGKRDRTTVKMRQQGVQSGGRNRKRGPGSNNAGLRLGKSWPRVSFGTNDVTSGVMIATRDLPGGIRTGWVTLDEMQLAATRALRAERSDLSFELCARAVLTIFKRSENGDRRATEWLGRYCPDPTV